jgi:hypothetical protein
VASGSTIIAKLASGKRFRFSEANNIFKATMPAT